MPNDVYYGSDLECRIGVMANANTDPTVWHKVELIKATFAPGRDRKARPKLGSLRHNALDPIKPVDGFFRLSGDLVLDSDIHMLARVLRCVLGAPVTTGPASGLYTHTWASGSKTPALCAIQVRLGTTGKVRVYRGITLGAVSLQAGGEQVQDYDIQLGLRGLSRQRVADWLAGTINEVPSAAPANRAVFRANGVAASNTLTASWSYDRGLTEDAYLSPKAELSGLRPGSSTLTGSARFRAESAAFDDYEEAGDVLAVDIQLLGLVTGQEIRLEHPHAQLNAAPLAIEGPAEVERTFAWSAHQDTTTPGARIVIVSDVASYAAA